MELFPLALIRSPLFASNPPRFGGRSNPLTLVLPSLHYNSLNLTKGGRLRTNGNTPQDPRNSTHSPTDRTYRSVLFALICYFFVIPAPPLTPPRSLFRRFLIHISPPPSIRDAYRHRGWELLSTDFKSGFFLQLDEIKFRA